MDRTELVLLALLPVLMVASAFASASETALFGVTPGELARLRRVAPGTARAVERLRAFPRRLLAQVLLVNMVANVGYFVVTSVLTVRAGSPGAKVAVSFGSVLAIVLLGEVLAKLFATAARVGFLRFAAPAHLAMAGVLAPFLAGFDRFVIAPLARLLVSDSSEPLPVTPEELGALIELSAHDGALRGSEQGLLRSIVDMGEVRVRDVMRPRVDLVCVERDAPRESVVEVCARTGHSRFPVCVGGFDGQVVGMLDGTRLLAGETYQRAVSAPRFVPELARVDAVLERFRDEGVAAAICVDEHGGVAGMVTISDIVDELVGSADDGDGGADGGIERTGERTWLVPGRLGVREIGDVFGVKKADGLRPGRATTIAGLVMALLGRVPVEGDEVRFGDLTLRVVRVDGRSVERVEVTLRERAA